MDILQDIEALNGEIKEISSISSLHKLVMWMVYDNDFRNSKVLRNSVKFSGAKDLLTLGRTLEPSGKHYAVCSFEQKEINVDGPLRVYKKKSFYYLSFAEIEKCLSKI